MIQLTTRWWRRAVMVAAVATLGASAGWSAASAAEPAANATGIDIRVPRVPVAIVGTLSGGTTGTPAAYATAYAIDPHGHTAGQAEADGSGTYRLTGLPNGDYRIAASPGFGDPALQRGFYRAEAQGHFTITLANATVLHYGGHKLSGTDLTLPVGYTLSGRIVRAATGAGVGDVSVSAEAADSSLLSIGSTTTDATGRYHLDGLSRRSYTLHVSAFMASVNVQSGCYKPTGAAHFTPDCDSAPAFTMRGNTTGVNVALPRGLTVSGSIVDRVSAATLCGTVRIVPPGSTSEISSDSACGSFAVDHLSPGRYQVIVDPQFGAPFETGAYNSGNPNLWVPEGAAPTTVHLVDDLNLGIIRPLQGHVVSGRVRDTAGHPVASVSVTITGSDGWCCRSATTAADGTFAMAGLANRRYVIFFDSTGPLESGWYDAASPQGFAVHRDHATAFAMPADRTGVNVRLPRGYSVSGRITDPQGHGVYSYLGSDGEGAPGGGHGSDSNGYYTIDGFAPGSYRITVVPASSTGIPFQSGWFSATAPGHFTPHRRNATLVRVGP